MPVSTEQQGVSQMMSAISTLGVQAVSVGLAQMSRDQLMQAQRDTNALLATIRAEGGTPEQTANANTLLNLINQQTQSGTTPQGTSTTTMVIVGGLALAATYFFLRSKKKR